MNCEQAKEQFADCLLRGVEDFELQSHLRDCGACRDEYALVRRTWETLDLLPVVEPTAAVRERFYQTLEAYQHGAGHRKQTSRWFAWWPNQPAFQFAAGLAMLTVGAMIGHTVGVRNQKQPELAQLQTEVSNMRQLVALSLLQQQSANDRLKGVTWAYQVERDDKEMLNALLQTVNHDPNVNVRLAAVDALRNFAGQQAARRGISQSLQKQVDPLVQTSLLDLIADMGDRQAAPAVRLLLERPDLEASVRARAGRLLTKFE